MEVIKSMNILVVGDSYAEHHPGLGWTSLVEKHFNCNVDNYAKPGSSINYAYSVLTDRLKTVKYDVVIFVLTSGNRIYHRNMFIHAGYMKYNNGDPVSDDIKKAVKNYYLHLYDEANTPIMEHMACHALTSISLEHPDTKFIFIPAFEEFKKINNGNCVITKKRLIHYSMLDKKNHTAEVRGKLVERINHLSFRQNKTLSDYVISFINDYKFGEVTYKSLDKLTIWK
jgi:hypothetical protein